MMSPCEEGLGNSGMEELPFNSKRSPTESVYHDWSMKGEHRGGKTVQSTNCRREKTNVSGSSDV